MSLLVGITGVICILTAFILDEFYRKFNSETISYNLLNIAGSGLLIYYALILKSWPFVTLNAVWLAAAVIKIVKIIPNRNKNSYRRHK